MIINCETVEVLRDTISNEITSVKYFLAEIEKCFAKAKKGKTSALLHIFISMKYQGKGDVEEYIRECQIFLQNLRH